MDTPTPNTDTSQSVKRLVGALIIGIGGLLLLDQLMAQLAPETTAEREDGLHQIDHRSPPPAGRQMRIVEA